MKGMIAKIRERFRRDMVRPLVYVAFVRFVLALTLALLVDFFFRPVVNRDLREGAFLLLALIFALMAVVAWLRLDGIRLPRLMMLRVHPRKKPTRLYGDIADHLDERPVTDFGDLDDGEKDAVLLCADAICCALFLAAALITDLFL